MDQQTPSPQQPQPTSSPQPVKVTNPSISHLNQQYASRISNGDIELTASRNQSRLSPEQAYNQKCKVRRLSKAKREKEELQKKLAYLNMSIQSIQNYNYGTGRVSQMSHSPQHGKESEVDVKQFVKKNHQFHQRVKSEKKQIEEKKQMQKQRYQQKQKMIEEAKTKQVEEQKAKKKQQILQNMQKIKSRMQNRQSQIKAQQEDYHNLIARTTLFKKIKKQQAELQNNLLQERKKKLATIRNLHRPISINQIEQHQRKCAQALHQKQALRQQQRRLSYAVDTYRVSYKSPHHKQYSQEHSMTEELNQSRIKAEKMKQFSEHVRENFVPQVDDKKRQTLQSQLEQQQDAKLRRQAKQAEDRKRSQQIRSKGLRYLQQVRELPKKKQNPSQVGPATERPRYTNYLTHSQHDGKTRWGSILESRISKKDKAIRMQFESQKIENVLKLKQQKARLLNKDPDQVDEEYYEMIKAKLDLLQI